MFKAPRIAARPEQERLRRAEKTELRRVALAEHDEARLFVRSDERVGFRRDIFGKEARAGGGACARQIVEILHEVRYAGEGPLREAALRSFAGAVVELRHDGIHLAVHLLHPLDAGIDQIERRHVAIAHQLGLRKRIHLRQLRRGKRRTQPRAIGARDQSRRRRRFQECPPREIHAHHHFLHLPALQGAILLTRKANAWT